MQLRLRRPARDVPSDVLYESKNYYEPGWRTYCMAVFRKHCTIEEPLFMKMFTGQKNLIAENAIKLPLCVISGFRCDVDEVYALLGYYL